MLGHQESAGFMQTKWDGAPSVICGTDPKSGMFSLELNLYLLRLNLSYASKTQMMIGNEGDLAENSSSLEIFC